MMVKRTSILNVQISAINYEITLDQIKKWIAAGKRTYICVAAVHLVMECQKDKRLLEGVNRGGLVTPDGMPLVWLSYLYGQKQVSRVYGPTLMLKTCALAQQKGYPIFLLGGKTGQSVRLKEKLQERFPNLKIVGAQDTPWRPIPQNSFEKINKTINLSGAQIVFVGLGCPWQERWMVENRVKLKPPILIGVGASFDFLSGEVRQAPKLLQQTGLEWAFRLSQEPARLFHRYLVLNSLFLFKIGRQLLVDFVFQ